MTRIAIILGSTRPNRVGEPVANWAYDIASQRDDADYELVDLRDFALPHFDEPLSPFLGQYQHDHTLAWAEKIASFDGFIFVTAEYNSHLPGALKNAVDYLHAEWKDKAVGIISYGITGGSGAAAQLRQMCGPLGMADVPMAVRLMFVTDFENYTVFTPAADRAALLGMLFDQVVSWSSALAPLREEVAVAP
jgi:NAD(P)H-dependent FMN reductase